MRPRYKDLFARMASKDVDERDKAFDAVLFDRSHALPDLAELYQEARNDANLRFMATQLISFTSSKRAWPHLIEALRDEDTRIRVEACLGLEELKCVEALDALEGMLNDRDVEVRQAAATAISALRKRASK